MLLEAAGDVRGRAPSVAARLLSSAGGLLPPGPDDRRRVVTLMEARGTACRRRLRRRAARARPRARVRHRPRRRPRRAPGRDAHRARRHARPAAGRRGRDRRRAGADRRPAVARPAAAGGHPSRPGWPAAWQRASDRAAAVLAVAGATDGQRFYAAAIGASAVASTGDLGRARELATRRTGSSTGSRSRPARRCPARASGCSQACSGSASPTRSSGTTPPRPRASSRACGWHARAGTSIRDFELRYLLAAARLMNGDLEAAVSAPRTRSSTRACSASTRSWTGRSGSTAGRSTGAACSTAPSRPARRSSAGWPGACRRPPSAARCARSPRPVSTAASRAAPPTACSRSRVGATCATCSRSTTRGRTACSPRCAAALGDLREAREHALAAARVATARGLARDRADARESAATLELARGRYRPAVARAREALAAADHPFQSHRVRLLLGEALARAGEPELAIVELPAPTSPCARSAPHACATAPRRACARSA